MWFTRTALIALVSLVAGLVLPASAQAARAHDKYAGSAFSATNGERTGRDLGRLRQSGCLQKFAQRQARKMAEQATMFHQDLGPILRECDLSTTGENVAYGFANGKAVVRAWMASEGHRANILREEYRLMGLAAHRSDDGRWYAAQVFGRKA